MKQPQAFMRITTHTGHFI